MNRTRRLQRNQVYNRARTRNQTHNKSGGYQALEPRRLLAVSAAIVDGEIMIAGDTDQQLVVAMDETGKASVLDGESLVGSFTTFDRVNIQLDGEASNHLFVDLGANQLDQLFVNLGNGNNRVEISNGEIDNTRLLGGTGDDSFEVAHDATIGKLEIRAAAGDDSVRIDGDVERRAMIQGGQGNDSVYIDTKAVVTDRLFASLGAGDNSLAVDGVINGRLSVFARGGNDTVTIAEDAEVIGQTRISLGGGNDNVAHYGIIDAGLNIQTGRGNDEVIIAESASIGAATNVNLGSGDNQLVLSGSVDGDFNVRSENPDDLVNIQEVATVTGDTNVELELVAHVNANFLNQIHDVPVTQSSLTIRNGFTRARRAQFFVAL